MPHTHAYKLLSEYQIVEARSTLLTTILLRNTGGFLHQQAALHDVPGRKDNSAVRTFHSTRTQRTPNRLSVAKTGTLTMLLSCYYARTSSLAFMAGPLLHTDCKYFTFQGSMKALQPGFQASIRQLEAEFTILNAARAICSICSKRQLEGFGLELRKRDMQFVTLNFN